MTFERRTDVALDGEVVERPQKSLISPATALAPSVPVLIPLPAVLWGKEMHLYLSLVQSVVSRRKTVYLLSKPHLVLCIASTGCGNDPF